MATTSSKRNSKPSADANGTPGKLIYTFPVGKAQMRTLLGGERCWAARAPAWPR